MSDVRFQVVICFICRIPHASILSAPPYAQNSTKPCHFSKLSPHERKFFHTITPEVALLRLLVSLLKWRQKWWSISTLGLDWRPVKSNQFHNRLHCILLSCNATRCSFLHSCNKSGTPQPGTQDCKSYTAFALGRNQSGREWWTWHGCK